MIVGLKERGDGGIAVQLDDDNYKLNQIVDIKWQGKIRKAEILFFTLGRTATVYLLD